MSEKRPVGFLEAFVMWIAMFLRNIRNFIHKCKKPSVKEYTGLLKAHLAGLLLLGLFGYVVKVIHIPINNIIAGSE